MNAANSVQRNSAPKVRGTAPRGVAAFRSVPFTELFMPKAGACACGGGCPRCQSDLPIQAKLAVSQPGDIYEQEADRVAEQVMRMPAPTLKRACASCSVGGAPCPKCIGEKEESVQRKTEPASDTAEAAVSDDFLLNCGPGHSLDPATRTFMESRFGHNFSHVRLHTDDRAADSARSVNAMAYTLGRDIVFGSGQYVPTTASGKRLLAHELAHVVQQGTAGASRVKAQHKPANRMVQRYSHQNCKEEELNPLIWIPDGIAKEMVKKARDVLSDTRQMTDPWVKSLLKKYFKDSNPTGLKLGVIRGHYTQLSTAFGRNDYTYECEETCDENAHEAGYTWCGIGDIHLCMPIIRNWKDHCIARLMIHEFLHRYACLKDKEYCETSCYDGSDPIHLSGCSTQLNEQDAVFNVDSYAGFAWALWILKI